MSRTRPIRPRHLLLAATATLAMAVPAGGSTAETAPASVPAPAPAAAPDRTVLPMVSDTFTGKIGTTYADSRPAFPAPIRAPDGAPNVLLVMTDDVGFASASTFGGPVPTPNLTRLAEAGLIFSRFHTTAMCSPTRAALLTGRNHHAVANGTVANFTGGYPGYWSDVPRSAATLAEVLKLNGWNTAMEGKHHMGRQTVVSAAGPFKDWPTGLGFDHYYGFFAAESNQFTPALYRGTTPAPDLPAGEVLDTALANDSIDWIRNQKAADPDKPFFLYLATGTAHAPHQAPADWIAKFRGKFDAGWDKLRADILKRQEKIGMVPKGTVPSARPDAIPAWEALSPDEKKINARLMEVFAAQLAFQDHEFGRIYDELARMGELDNTLIVFIEGDNGAAAEAGMLGSNNPMAGFANGYEETVATLLKVLPDLGGPNSNNNYGFGWAWMLDTPFPLFKQYASHLGGVRNPMVVSWPKGVKARGVRAQFTHVTDVMPTVLELAGLPQPKSVNGIAQQRMDGTSFAYALAAADAPERHTTQYFEMMGNRGIYHDGWWAGTVPVKLPWSNPADYQNKLPTDYVWALYDLRKDPAQTHDLAAAEPAKLKEMQALFHSEAERNHVYPLDDRLTLARFREASAAGRPPRQNYTYWGSGVTIPYDNAAQILGRAFRITSEITVPDQSVSGAIVAVGGRFGGWAFYLQDNRPAAVVAVSQRAEDVFRVESAAALRPGKHRVTYDFRYDGGRNAGGEMVISVDGREVARGRIEKTLSKLVEMIDTLDVGFDRATPVTDAYPQGARFDGVARVDIALGPLGAAGEAPAQP